MEADVLEHAKRAHLLVVPLATRSLKLGHALIASPGPPTSIRSGGHGTDGLVKLLATQATTALAVLADRDRTGGATVKDPGSSAYSFAYYVDVAGREID